MELFKDYRMTARDCRHFYLRAASTGLVAVAFSLLIIISSKEPAGPGPWLIFGISLGLELILWGAFNLNKEEPYFTWAKALLEHSNTWFPVYLFLMRKLFIILFFILLWTTLQDLGMQTSLFCNVVFILLLTAVPTKGILREINEVRQTERTEHAHDLTRHLVIILSTLLTASLLSALNTSDNTTASEVNMLQIIVWLLACVISITCVLLFFSRLPRHKPDPAKTALKVRERAARKPEEYIEY